MVSLVIMAIFAKVIVLDNLQRVVITFQCHQSLIIPQANKIMRSEIVLFIIIICVKVFT